MAASGMLVRRMPRPRGLGLVLAALVVVALLTAALVAGGGGGPPRPAAGHGPVKTVGAPAGAGAGAQGGEGAAGGATGGGASLAAGGAGVGGVAGGIGASGAGAAGAGATSAGSSGAAVPVPGPAPVTPLTPAKVIKNGQIGLQVRAGRVASTLTALTLLASGEGGFVASTTSSQAGSTPSGSVVLRVPADAFESTVAKVRALGTVESASTSGQDVTSQYVDLQARITALQQAQGRYLAILARANSIGDILAVQQQVDSVDTQLEQLEGQQRVLDDQTSYGTLTVNVDQRTAPAPPPRPAPGPWKTAVLRAGNGFADGIQGLISVSGGLAFALILGVAVGLLGWLGWRRLGPGGRKPDGIRAA